MIGLIGMVVSGVVAGEIRSDEIGRGDPSVIDEPRLIAPLVERLRAAPGRAIADDDTRAVVEGVVFGRTGDLDPMLRDAFLTSGLWHLLAASGQNIALVVLCCVTTVWLAGLSRRTGLLIALCAIPAYVLVVGGGASIVRAAIMGSIGVIAWLAGGRAHAWSALLAAATVMVWAMPGVHRTLGFQLSFACVAGLLAVASRGQRALVARGMPRWLATLLLATLTCSTVTMPILMLRVGEAPLVGGVTNVVGVPLASAILIVGLVGAIVGLVVPPAGNVLMLMAGAMASLLSRTAEVGARMPYASISAADIPAVATVGIAAWAVWWWMRRDRPTCSSRAGAASRGAMPARVAVWACCAAASVLTVALIVASVLPSSTRHDGQPASASVRPTVTFLDVGQGDAVLISSGGRHVLVDTGPRDGRVVRAMRRHDVSSIDGVLLTHDHADHAGAVPGVSRAFSPDWIASGATVAAAPYSQVTCEGDLLHMPDVRIEVLFPPCPSQARSAAPTSHAPGSNERNATSLVLMVTGPDRSVLLTGDAESPQLKRASLRPADVMQIGHHGSADEHLSDVLNDVRPSLAIISVGTNGYGHPAPQTLDMLGAARIPHRRTDRDGDVAVELSERQ